MIRALSLVAVIATVALSAVFLGGHASAQVLGGSSVNATGRSNVTLSAPRYVSTAASGSNGFACTVDGCRMDLGTGASDYLYSSGSAVSTPGALSAAGTIYASAFTNSASAASVFRGGVIDGASAIAVKITNLNALSTTGAKIVSFYSDSGTTEKMAVMNTGAVLQAGVAFASLGTPANGTLVYCSDCTFANPCASSGTGAFAKRLNGAWRCD